MERQQMDERLYDQLVAYLAGKGTVREDAAAGVLIIRELDGRAFDPPFRLHVTPPGLRQHLEDTAADAATAHPDVIPLEAAWRQFTLHVHEAVAAAGPGETDLVVGSKGLSAQRPPSTG